MNFKPNIIIIGLFYKNNIFISIITCNIFKNNLITWMFFKHSTVKLLFALNIYKTYLNIFTDTSSSYDNNTLDDIR